jgi:hypothetical protein
MPVYGEMLSVFPELLREFKVFKMKPRTGGGYGERYDEKSVRGYWSWRKQSKLDEQGGLLALNYQATFWAKVDFFTREAQIAQGDFVEVDAEVFRVIDDQNFSREGGFTKCLMARLVGPTDQQVTNRRVDGVIANDY